MKTRRRETSRLELGGRETGVAGNGAFGWKRRGVVIEVGVGVGTMYSGVGVCRHGGIGRVHLEGKGLNIWRGCLIWRMGLLEVSLLERTTLRCPEPACAPSHVEHVYFEVHTGSEESHDIT